MTPLLKTQLPRINICDILTDYCPSETRLSTKDLDKRFAPVLFPLSSTHSLCLYSRHMCDLESVMALPRLRYLITDEHRMNGLIASNKIAECRSINKGIRIGHMIKSILFRPLQKRIKGRDHDFQLFRHGG
jgi:hypothetical protein